MTRLSPYVNYERHAALYQQGRATPADVMDRWAAAIRPQLPSPRRSPLRVLDLGAGTGIFTRTWSQWTEGPVVAIEPVTAMIEEGRRNGAPYIQAIAERLPLKDEEFDLVWASTTLHHFGDIEQATTEVGRVLQPAGKVMVRSHVPHHSDITWLSALPAAARAKAEARMPNIDWYAGVFQPHGLTIDHVENVPEETGTWADAADWIERMRHADTMLTALSDDEIAAGAEVLRASPDRPAHVSLTLLVLARQ